MKPKSKLHSFLALAGTSLLAISYTHAANIWDGDTDGNWSTATNWDDNNLPGTGALTFTGEVQTSTNNDRAAALSYGGINFTNDGSAGKTSAFTLAGSQITLGGDITTTANTTGSTITDLISLDMILSGNRFVITNQLSDSVQHNLEISGVISQSGTRGPVKIGRGTLTISGSASNSYTGLTVVREGVLILNKSGTAKAIASGTLQIGYNYRNYDITNTVKLTGTSADQINDGTTVRVFGRGHFDFNGKDETISQLDISGSMAKYGDPTHVINTAGGGSLTTTHATSINIAPVGGFNSQINSGSGIINLGGNVTFSSSSLTANAGGGAPSLPAKANPTGQAQISGNLELGATRTFSVAAGTGTGHDLLVDAVISGTGFGIDKTGAGRLVLGGANTYDGLTTVSDGTLIATHGSALTDKSVTVADNKSFVYAPTVAGALNLGTGVLTLGTVTGTTTSIGTALGGTAGQSAITSSSAAVLGGTGVVNIQAIPGATLTAGTNNLITAASGLDGGTYTLGTVYNNTNYTVTVDTFARTGTAISVDVASAAALSGNVYWKGGLANVAGNTGVWAASNGSTTSNWQVTDTVDQPLAPGAAADLVFDSTEITSPGTMASMSLGANMSVRSVTVNDTDTAFGLLGDGNALTITPASSTTGLTIASGAPASSIAANVVLGADQTWTNNSANTLDTTGVISGSAHLTIAGTGRVDLKAENRLNGGITLSGSTVGVSWATANMNDFTITGTATLDATLDGRFGSNSNYIAAEKGGIAINPGANLTLRVVDSYKVFGALTGSGTFNLQGRAEFVGALNTHTGPINLTSTTAQSRLIVNSLADAGSPGSGDITLTGTGNTAGFFVGNDFGLGGITFTNRRFVLAGAAQTTGTTEIGHGGNSVLTIASNIINDATAAKTLTISGNAGLGSGTISGTITDSTNALSVSKAGSGTWNLTNANNSYTGATTITRGTLSINSIANLGSNSAIGAPTSEADGRIVIGSGNDTGTLLYTGAEAPTNRTIQINSSNNNNTGGAIIINDGAGALTFTATSFNNAYTNASAVTRTLTLGGTNGGEIEGIIQNNSATNLVAVTKSGVGTWVLTNPSNTYTGITTVSAGTLIVDGSIASSSLTTVQSGTLGGSGTVGPLTIGDDIGSADAILAPGNSIGSIDTGNLTFNSDGKYTVELNGTSVTTDVINVTGTVTIHAATTLAASVAGTLSANQQYVIVSNDAADAITGTFAGLAQDAVVGSYGGIDLKISYTGGDGNDIVLYTPASGTAFDTWAATGTLGAVTFNGDTNGDGVKDGLAFLLGAANPDDNAIGRLPTVTESGGNLTLTFNMLNAASRGTTAALSVEHSSDLGIGDDWTTVLVPDVSGGPTSGVTFLVTPGSPTNTVTATIGLAEAAAGKLFGRLKATE